LDFSYLKLIKVHSHRSYFAGSVPVLHRTSQESGSDSFVLVKEF